MKWIPLGIALASLVLISAGTTDSPRISASVPPELQPFVGGNLEFAADLLPKLQARDGNLALSPYSLAAVLAVAQAGAMGQTASEITAACHFPASQTQLATSVSRVRSQLDAICKSGSVQLNSATGLWAQKDYGFEESFLKLARETHGAEIQTVDYVRSTGTVLNQINAWIKKNTRGKITGGIPASSVTPDTRLVVANAIYFKGQWASRFDRNATRNRPFHISASASVDVPMMKQEHNFLYAERDGVQLLVLPYVGQSLHMLVLLPKQGGLTELEGQLNAGYLESWTSKVGLCKVDVLLPRFSIVSSHSLVKPLQSLGMQDAFDAGRADFSGMSRRRPLFIQTAEQTCLVEVNEEGTVAAAATHTSFGCAATIEPEHVTFHADRPFLFLIRENNTGMVLFVGRVANPAS